MDTSRLRPASARASIATILFTDLVGSTELMAGRDESAQRLFDAHHRLLSPWPPRGS